MGERMPYGQVDGVMLIRGVVGSTAYGTATEHSDVDRAGMYVAPTIRFGALFDEDLPLGTYRWRAPDPDLVVHEASKFVRLVLTNAPGQMELLWLDEYEVLHPLGSRLLGIRERLLGANRVRCAYVGYADKAREKITGTPRQRAKKAGHVLRILQQGLLIYRTGKVYVQVEDPDEIRAFGERVAAGDMALLNKTVRNYVYLFDHAKTPLPERADRDVAKEWLLSARRQMLTDSEAGAS